jgi:hypothetical protein
MAGTFDGTILRFYLDGQEAATLDFSGTMGTSTHRVTLGSNSQVDGRFFDGKLDDARIYSRALTLEEIQDVMRGDTKMASDPQPESGATVDIRNVTSLIWSAGDTAVQHDVYFGTEGDALRGADANSPEYMGRQAGTSFALDGLVEFGGGDYYWRIDEVEADGTIRAGTVWSFAVPDYLMIDDFERYTNDVGNRVFQAWVDGLGYSEPAPGHPGNGTGAIVGHDIWDETGEHYNRSIADIDDPHGGHQAMPLYFDNSASPYYSETERTWTTPQNLTVEGVTDLSLWVKGAPISFLEDTATGTITMSSTSGDIYYTADYFRYAWKELNGDGTIVAKVESVDGTAAWAKAGVMIRSSLDVGAQYAFTFLTPEGRPAFQNRAAVDSDAASTHGEPGDLTFPYWVKIERTGSEFTASFSQDGVTWIPQEQTSDDASPNPRTIFMTSRVYIGLAVTSNNDAASPCIAEFSNVSATGTVSGQWQVADIGGANIGNGPADLYVAIEDSSGRVAEATYADGTNLSDWTPWKIPLSDFTGVSLTAVKKMYIGVGNRNAPVADGVGMVLIDDVSVVLPETGDPNDVGG